ncbi:MAG: efflux transporter outer membrane subunit [Candidatus Eremiobacteraeota bacterium]|nr:efflux transporter outer membrane subunit [Candidatus Eremiobacteraeota bacterium]
MKRAAHVSLLGLLILLGGCTNPVPPTPPVLPVPSPTDYNSAPARTAAADVKGGAAQRFLTGGDVQGQWWALFHSPALDALVSEAFAANPDVKAAQAALRSAREAFYAQRSSAYPTLQGSFSVQRIQVPPFYAPPLTTNTSEYVYGLHTASLDVAYTPDVFGNLRYQTRVAGAAYLMQRFETEATYLTLSSNLVAAVIQAASLRDQIASTQRTIVIDQGLLKLAEAARKNGQLTALDVLNQESILRQAEETLPPLERALAQTRDLLARLVGRTPSIAPDEAFTLDSLQLPEELPLSLPSKLVAQRPDIAAAEANLEQASALVGVAYTNRLPNISITPQVATQALTLAGLFGPGSLLSTLTAQIISTLYDQGTLKHRQASAVAAYEEAASLYASAVLTGFQNVADGVVALQKDADAVVSANRAAQAAEKAMRIVLVQKRVGEVSNVAVLTAQQIYEASELTLVQAKTARYTDTVALFQALGGGWWNR